MIYKWSMITATQKAVITVNQFNVYIIHILLSGFFNIPCELSCITIIFQAQTSDSSGTFIRFKSRQAFAEDTQFWNAGIFRGIKTIIANHIIIQESFYLPVFCYGFICHHLCAQKSLFLTAESHKKY